MNIFHYILISTTFIMWFAMLVAQPKVKRVNKDSIVGTIATFIYLTLIILSALWH